MKNFIGIRLSSNKSYMDNYLQNSLPGLELKLGLPRDRRGYSPLYYRGSDVGTENKSFCISFTKKNDCSKEVLQKIQSCKAEVITLLYVTQISTKLMKDK